MKIRPYKPLYEAKVLAEAYAKVLKRVDESNGPDEGAESEISLLGEIDGKTLKDVVGWLKDEDCGCFHRKVGYMGDDEIDIVVGWHDRGDKPDDWCIAWKIGVQGPHNAMWTDMDIDFDMPVDGKTGEVYDTLEIIEDGTTDWDGLASDINNRAREVVKWAAESETEEED